MRVLLLNQFYPPDMAPTGQLLHALGRTLAARGHEVRVVCSRGADDGRSRAAARETLDGVEIQRLPAFACGRSGAGRLLDYASFYLQLIARTMLRRQAPELVVALTTPPYIGLVGSLLGRTRGSAHAHWVMDLYPDVLTAHGMAAHRSVLIGALEALNRMQFQGSVAVLALGPYMRARMRPYTTGVPLTWVPLWGVSTAERIMSEQVMQLRIERGWARDDTVLMYSGNMGLGHSFDEFLEAARRLGAEGPLWAFVGGGHRRKEIERHAATHPETRLQLLPYVPREKLREGLSAADVHLVSLRSTWQGLIVPSKIAAAFSVGRPVIFVGPPENEAAQWIEESGGGWLVREGDVDGLLTAVTQASDRIERVRRAEAALAYAREHFDPQRNCDRIARLLEHAVAGRQIGMSDGSVS